MFVSIFHITFNSLWNNWDSCETWENLASLDDGFEDFLMDLVRVVWGKWELQHLE